MIDIGKCLTCGKELSDNRKAYCSKQCRNEYARRRYAETLSSLKNEDKIEVEEAPRESTMKRLAETALEATNLGTTYGKLMCKRYLEGLKKGKSK